MFWICSRIRCGFLASGYLSDIFNGQCTMSSLLAQSSFGPRLLSPRLYLRPSRCKRKFRSCGRVRRRIFAHVSSSLFYNLGKPIWRAFHSWDFQSTSYALQSVVRLPSSSRDFPELRRNNLKRLPDAFLFTPTLINACIKVCYYKNKISASRRVADSDARSKLSFAKCETFRLVILNIAGHYPTRAMPGEIVTYESQFTRLQLQTLLS